MSLPSILSSFYVFVFVVPTFVCLFVFFISAENSFCFCASTSVDVPSEPWQLSVRSPRYEAAIQVRLSQLFLSPISLPHTSSSLILLRALIPNVKQTQLEVQHSVLIRPLEIHINYVASMNKCRDDCTIYFFHVRSHK